MLVNLLRAALAGAIGAIAVWGAIQLAVIPWVLFLSWVCFFLFGPEPKPAALAVAHMVIGLLLAVIVQLADATLAPIFGVWSIVGIVFCLITVLGLFESLPPMNIVPAYYIGLVAFMASGLPPELDSFVAMTLPILAGFGLGWITVVAQARVVSRPIVQSAPTDRVGFTAAKSDRP